MDRRWILVVLFSLSLIVPVGSTSGYRLEVDTEIPEYILEDHLNLTGTCTDFGNWGAGDTSNEDFRRGNLTNVTIRSIGNGAVGLEPELDFQILNSGNPVLEPGTGSDWDTIITDCAIVKDGNQYYMYYIGTTYIGYLAPYQIGLATSSNGLSWTKYSGNPILKYHINSFDYDGMSTPQVIKDGSLWRMYYGGYTHDGVSNYIDVCYAYSSDGINWTKYASNPLISHGSPISSWDGRLAQPSCLARSENGSFLLYFRGKGSSGVTWLGLATSEDGLNWSKNSSNPLRRASTSGWENNWFFAYSLDQGNGTYRLWTTGDTSKNKIGYCTSEDLVTWTDSGSAVFTPKAGTAYSKGVSSPMVLDFGDHYRMYLRGQDDSDVYRFFAFNVTPKKMDGEFVSERIVVGGNLVKLRKISWTEDVPPGGSLNMSIRWSNQTGQWGEWKPVTNGSDLHNITARYFQYKAEMRVDVDWVSIALLDVLINYNDLMGSVEVSVDGGAWQAVNGSLEDWHLNVSLHDGDYDIVVEAVNSFGSTKNETIPVKVDLYPPTGNITIEDGRYAHNSTSVKIDVGANDTHHPIEMQMSRTPDFSLSTWWPHYPSRTYGLLDEPEGNVTIYLRLRDAAGRISETYNDSIVIDTTPPEGTLSINEGAKYTNSTMVTLRWIATDLTGVVGMMASNDPDFEGAIWEDPMKAFSWVIGETDGTHTVYMKIRDFIGWETVLVDDIILDRTPPAATLMIDQGVAFTTTRDVTLNITLYDENPLSFKLTNFGEPWPDSWRTSGSPVDIPWTLLLGPDDQRTVRMLVMDAAGNHVLRTADVMLDTTPPEGTLLLNDGALFTNKQVVDVTLMASDVTSGVDRIRVSDTDDFTGASWQTLEETFLWPMPAGEGMKTLFVQIRDVAGLVSTIDASILFDSTPPSGSVAIKDVGDYATNPEVELLLDFQDGIGMDAMMVSEAIEFPDAVWVPYSKLYPWDLGDEDGEVTVYVKGRDLAGNTFTVTVSTILDITNPEASTSLPGSTLSRTVEFPWSASDNIGLDRVQWTIENGETTVVLVGGTRIADGIGQFEITEAMTPGDSESYDLTIDLIVRDLAGMVTVKINKITFIPEIPSGALIINDDAGWTNLSRVSLAIIHSGGLSPTHHRVAPTEAGLDSAEWREWTASTTIDLDLPGGVKTVWGQLMGPFDVLSEPFSDTIKLDIEAPIIDIISPTKENTDDETIILSVLVSDDQDPNPMVEWRLNSGEIRPYTGDMKVSLKEGDNHIEVRVQDAAGNVDTAVLTITYDQGLSVGSASWLILVVILVVVALVGVWYWRNRQRDEGTG